MQIDQTIILSLSWRKKYFIDSYIYLIKIFNQIAIKYDSFVDFPALLFFKFDFVIAENTVKATNRVCSRYVSASLSVSYP